VLNPLPRSQAGEESVAREQEVEQAIVAGDWERLYLLSDVSWALPFISTPAPPLEMLRSAWLGLEAARRLDPTQRKLRDTSALYRAMLRDAWQKGSPDLARVGEWAAELALRHRDSGTAWQLASSALWWAQKCDSAVVAARVAVDLGPQDPFAHIALALARAELGEEGAMESFTRAVELAPGLFEAHAHRGEAYWKAGDYDRALEDFSGALELDPDDPIVRANRASAYAMKGDYARAVEDYDHAIRLKPRFAWAWFGRGVVCKKAGWRDRAVESFREFLKLASEDRMSEEVSLAKEHLRELGADEAPEAREGGGGR